MNIRLEKLCSILIQVDVHSSSDFWWWLHQALQNREEETGIGGPGGREQEASHAHVAKTHFVE